MLLDVSVGGSMMTNDVVEETNIIESLVESDHHVQHDRRHPGTRHTQCNLSSK